LISSWVKANKMEAITSIWNSEGWDSKIPKDLKDIVSSNGEVWSVPVNVHRGNALWYNKKLLDSKGVTAPDTPEQMTSALSSLKAKGVAFPLALASKGGNWQVQMLLENNILAAGGADRDNAIGWLKVCGSQEGQAAFNPKKGSIPARTDVSPSLFDVIAQSFIAEFKTDTLVPSSAHGSATPPAFASAVNDEMGQF